MKILILIAVGFSAALSAGLSAPLSAAERGSIAVWNQQLLVTAPASESQTLPGGAQRLTVDWQHVTMAEAADFLRRATLLNVVVMPGCESRTLTLTVKDMGLTQVVRWISTQTDLAWTYQNEALVFSAAPLPGATVTRLYDLSDLVAPHRDFPGPELAFSSDTTSGRANGVLIGPVDSTAPQHDPDELADFLRRQLHLE